jgi:hypothetical protein
MLDLRQFIEQRRETIKAQISELKRELKELALAESAIKTGVAPTLPVTKTTKDGLTIKEMVIDVLSDLPDGAEASEIVDLIANKHGEVVVRSSLSPQLSRLKDEGVLELDGRIWRALQKEKGSEPTSSEPSQEFGGGEVRGQVFPAGSPEGATPSTSSSNRRVFDELDDDVPF